MPNDAYYTCPYCHTEHELERLDSDYCPEYHCHACGVKYDCDEPLPPTIFCSCGDRLKVTFGSVIFTTECLGCGVEYYLISVRGE